jgi:YD repeat-containing protein
VRNSITRTFAALVFAIVCMTAPLSVKAQQGGTTRYVYDDNGRLHAVIAPSGEAVVYEYDPAGNITSIQKLAADMLALFAFTPHEGLPGDYVTFTGVGFSGGVSNVSFNGATARVVSFTSSTIVAEVPQGATTGPVTITTPHGSITTPIPFTLVGVSLTPSFAALKFGESLQFTAQVLPSTLDQGVKWSVNGVDGGNGTVGTITTTGLYTAPRQVYPSVTIRATSIADALRFADARVKVSDPNDVQAVLSASVSVSRGDNPGTAALARLVAVQYGIAGEAQAAISKTIAVQYGTLSGSTAALSQSISVQHGNSEQTTALSNPVAVEYENALSQFFVLPNVSATKGPYIQSITPNNLTRNVATSVTINGVGLTGATALSFITTSGALDSSTVGSNITVNADGTSLTLTITPGSSAALGSRIVVIATANGDSVTVDLGTNTINVVP